MSKCICHQIADAVEQKGLSKIKVTTNHACFKGEVDVESTKSYDGILVLKNVEIKYDCGCESTSENAKNVECLALMGLHIVAAVFK